MKQSEKEKLTEDEIESEDIPSEYWADKEFVLESVKSSGMDLEYVSDELKADKEIVLEAVKSSGWALEYASDKLKADREIVLEAIKNRGKLVLDCASEELKNDPEFLEIIANLNR